MNGEKTGMIFREIRLSGAYKFYILLTSTYVVIVVRRITPVENPLANGIGARAGNSIDYYHHL